MQLMESKIFKSCFKRKIRITDSVLVSLLICGGISYSANIENNVGISISSTDNISKIDDSFIKNTATNNALSINLNDLNTNVKNDGIITSKINITRDKVSSTGAPGTPLFSYLTFSKNGNAVYGSNVIIKNNGIINSLVSIDGGNLNVENEDRYMNVITESEASGNGIFGGKNIENSGVIDGSLTIKGSSITTKETSKLIGAAPYSLGSGNGIYEGNIFNNEDRVVTVNNDGVIRGKVNIIGGTLNNNSSAIIDSNHSGNGIYVGNNNSVPTSTNSTVIIDSNKGTISGKIFLQGSNITVNNTLSGESSISVYSEFSGNGVASGQLDSRLKDTSNNTINIIKNDGIISGELSSKVETLINTSGSSTTDSTHPGYSALSSRSSGNGLVSDNVLVKENNGSIKGEAILVGGHSYITANEFYGTNSDLTSDKSGNGITGMKNSSVELNRGVISGYLTALQGSTNINLISTKAAVSIIQSGNGIFGANYVNNEGTISGYSSGSSPNQSGNGICLIDKKLSNEIINKGVIKGTKSAIETSADGVVKNYGVVAGGEVYSGKGSNSIVDTHSGLEIKLKVVDKKDIMLDSNGDVIIENVKSAISGTTIDNRIVMNATDSIEHTNILDKYFKLDNDTQFINNIINGVGIESGTLTVNNGSNLTLDNSIINAYKTAITLNNGSTLTASNSIFNGGGLKNIDNIIESNGDSSNIDLKENSIINGNTAIKGNNSTMSVSNKTQINGNVTSEGNNNRLILGDKNSASSNLLTIYKNIKGFDKIDTKGSVLLSPESSIDTGDITIKNDSKLTVALDGTSRDSNDYVVGHALYNHVGSIKLEKTPNYTGITPDIDEKAQLLFKASGLGEDTIIAMKGTDVSSINDYYLGTTSIAHTARKLNDTDGNIIITVKNFDDIFPDPVIPPIFIPVIPPDIIPVIPPVIPPVVPPVVIPVIIPDVIPVIPPVIPPVVPHNNKDIIEEREYVKEIYNKINDSKQIGTLSVTTDTSDNRKDTKSELLSLLDQIYANNPYAFAGEASKEAIDLFRISHQYVAIPELGDYIVSGSAISSYSNYDDVTMNNFIDGKNSDNKYSRNTNTYGGLGDIEYGLGSKSSVGLLVGGANQKVNMSHNSNLDGDILYLGAYHRKELGKYTFETGIGYQYASYDVTRNIYNKYQKIENNGDVDTNSIILYEDIRYLLKKSNGWKIEPKVSFTAVHVKQGSVEEKKSDLSINVDSQTYNYFDTEAGLEVTKEVILESGKLRTNGSLSYINSQGSSGEKLSSTFSQGGEKFEILGPELSANNGKVGLEFTYEKPSGLEYFSGIDYKFGECKKNTLFGKIGINYKF